MTDAMADGLGDQASAPATLRTLADSFEPCATGDPVADAAQPETRPCPACGVRVFVLDRHDDTPAGQQVVLNAGPVPYGAWLVSRTARGGVAVPYQPDRDDRRRFARYREHSCPGPFRTTTERTAS